MDSESSCSNASTQNIKISKNTWVNLKTFDNLNDYEFFIKYRSKSNVFKDMFIKPIINPATISLPFRLPFKSLVLLLNTFRCIFWPYLVWHIDCTYKPNQAFLTFNSEISLKLS